MIAARSDRDDDATAVSNLERVLCDGREVAVRSSAVCLIEKAPN